MYKILIVDDEPLVQIGVQSMLDCDGLELEICGIASNGKMAYDMIENNRPDIVVTDIKMPIMDGLSLVRLCREQYGSNSPEFIILSSYEEFYMAKEALTYQVIDYLIKIELTPQVINDAVKKAMERCKIKKPISMVTQLLTTNDMNSFYEKFYIRLLHNLFESEEQFNLQSHDLGFHFEYKSYAVSYLEIIRNSDNNMPLNKQIDLYTSSLQMLKDIIVKYLPCHIISLDFKHFAIIYCFRDIDNINYSDAILSIMQVVGKTLHNYYNVSLRAGTGILVESPMDIADSYQCARQIFSKTSIDTPYCAYDKDASTDTYKNAFNMALFRDSLIKAYEEFDSDVLYYTLTQIIELFSNSPSNFLQAMDISCNILYLSISLLPQGSEMVATIFKEHNDSYFSLYKQQTTQQLSEWMILFRDGLMNVFKEHKKEYKNHIVIKVKKYIASHINEHLTLNDVAAIFGISANYLSQLFKKYNDIGFSDYTTLCKIEKAKELLGDSHLKIYEISDMLGFESAFYFSKVFKKVCGVSPTEYQNQLLYVK